MESVTELMTESVTDSATKSMTDSVTKSVMDSVMESMIELGSGWLYDPLSPFCLQSLLSPESPSFLPQLFPIFMDDYDR